MFGSIKARFYNNDKRISFGYTVYIIVNEQWQNEVLTGKGQNEVRSEQNILINLNKYTDKVLNIQFGTKVHTSDGGKLESENRCLLRFSGAACAKF